MKRGKQGMNLAAIMAAMMMGSEHPDILGMGDRRKPAEKVVKEPIIPKGHKKFFFDEYGAEVEQGDPRFWIEIAALNLSNAKRKFLKLNNL